MWKTIFWPANAAQNKQCQKPSLHSGRRKGEVHWTRPTTSTSGCLDKNSCTAATEGVSLRANCGDRANTLTPEIKNLTTINIKWLFESPDWQKKVNNEAHNIRKIADLKQLIKTSSKSPILIFFHFVTLRVRPLPEMQPDSRIFGSTNVTRWHQVK